MSSAKANEIRKLIRQVRQNASALSRLRHFMAGSIPRLHRAIQLPDHDREAVLMEFVVRYLDLVPNCLDALRGLTQPAGIREYAGRFLDAAADTFLRSADSARSRGIISLMQRAYLANRLFEELNDQVLSRCGAPLVPVDMMHPNLLMHELIGEERANELDRQVENTVKSLLDEQPLNPSTVCNIVRRQRSSAWYLMLGQWPSLTENLRIAFSFSRTARRRPMPAPVAIH